jgi:hypothetical protein
LIKQIGGNVEDMKVEVKFRRVFLKKEVLVLDCFIDFSAQDSQKSLQFVSVFS